MNSYNVGLIDGGLAACSLVLLFNFAVDPLVATCLFGVSMYFYDHVKGNLDSEKPFSQDDYQYRLGLLDSSTFGMFKLYRTLSK